MSGRNAWVSYHALALELTVTRPDCQRSLRGSISLPARIDAAIPAAVPAEPQRASRVGEHDGADGDRTHDLRLAKPALSQLSYSPDGWGVAEAASPNGSEGRLEGPRGAPRAYPLTSGFRPGAGPVALV
jgi:hypothetical protein